MNPTPSVQNIPSTPPITPISSPTPPKSPNFLLPILGLILLISLAFSALLYYKNTQIQKRLDDFIATNEPPPTPTTQPTPTPSIDQTTTLKPSPTPTITIPSDWKTYNYENIFNFSYPKNFDLSIIKYKDINLPESENQILWLNLIQDVYKKSGQSPAITVLIFKTNTSLDSYIEKLKNKINQSIENFNNPENPYANTNQDPPKLISVKTKTIGNINAREIIRYQGPGAPNSNLTEYYFTNSNYLYRLSANYGTYNPDIKQNGTVELELLPQILSTFKFLD